MAETKKNSRVWFITGCSSGFGRLLAEEVLKAGDKVVATARNIATIADLEKQYPKTARAISLDVTHREQITTAVEQALEQFGHIDVLVNNAGYGMVAAIEEATGEDIRREIDTNVYGVVNVTRALLPHLRARRSGHVINLSSIAGIIASPGLGYYNLTKFAVEGFSEALATEIAPLGIKVTIIEPGPFRTEFLAGSLVESGEPIADYAETAGRTRVNMRKGSGSQKGDPRKAVAAIIQVVNAPEPPLRLLLGAIAFRRAHDKIALLERDAKAWEQVTLDADFPDGQ
ncbi:MAG TPA: oxidoreductase [Acidobacteriaceae bacterium]|jgi:NADP-dependent 3-hydroxy acid dehydrogenase YdfG|nr:oxidoreductase [Acidobacteriaceae bacterium]